MKYKFLILTRSDIQKSLLYFYMKALWLVSFRPIGKSKINDFIQSVFVDSINKTLTGTLTSTRHMVPLGSKT